MVFTEGAERYGDVRCSFPHHLYLYLQASLRRRLRLCLRASRSCGRDHRRRRGLPSRSSDIRRLAIAIAIGVGSRAYILRAWGSGEFQCTVCRCWGWGRERQCRAAGGGKAKAEREDRGDGEAGRGEGAEEAGGGVFAGDEGRGCLMLLPIQ